MEHIDQKLAEAFCTMLAEHLTRMAVEDPYELRGPASPVEVWVRGELPGANFVPIPSAEALQEMLCTFIRARYPEDAEAMLKRQAEMIEEIHGQIERNNTELSDDDLPF